MWPILLGLIFAWPYAVACVASISNISGVLNGQTGFPLLTIYYQATGSKAGATVLLVMFCVCFFGCMTACLTTCSRTLWAVSRDNALPYSKYWMKVSHTWQMPVNATCLSGVIMSVSTHENRVNLDAANHENLAVRPHLHWICECFLINDQRLYYLLPNLSGHPAGHCALARSRESATAALLCHPGALGQNREHRSGCLGCIRKFLFEFAGCFEALC